MPLTARKLTLGELYKKSSCCFRPCQREDALTGKGRQGGVKAGQRCAKASVQTWEPFQTPLQVSIRSFPVRPAGLTAQPTSDITGFQGNMTALPKRRPASVYKLEYKPLFHNIVTVHFLVRQVLRTQFKILGKRKPGVSQAGAKTWSRQADAFRGLQAARTRCTSVVRSVYLEPPPFLGPLVLISCQIFTRGSLFFQMSS